tara:strand:+ start:2520 stop:5243 length:2724 start_codon:yes stop_codon:yes gene_type:complete
MIQASNKKALELCHFDASKHVYIEGSEQGLSFGESSSFATEIHFYCEPNSQPIEPPGHQQGPAQWHGHQVLLSKFNGCVSGEYRIGLDAQRHVIFQREVSPWIVTTTDVIPLHEWHSIVCTYDGHFMRIYIDCRHCAHIECGPQKTDLTTPALLGADLCGYASAHHFEGYISEVSLWQRSLDASEVKALASSNPLNSKTLNKDLIGYWCVYQRASPSAPITNAVRLIGEQQFNGSYLVEGTPLLDRWRSWLANGGEALPRGVKPTAGAGGSLGPHFSKREGCYFFVTGSASVLSFGGQAAFTIAVQFLCHPSSPRDATNGQPDAAPSVLAAAASNGASNGAAGDACQILVSKFHSGIRGEYRIGLDSQLRPFFHREVEPWDMVAPTPLTLGAWHQVVATYDGVTMRLFVDRQLAVSAKAGPQFTDQVTPILIGAEYGRASIENHFEGFISEVRVWDRPLLGEEAAHVFESEEGKPSPLSRGMLGRWRPIDARLDEDDGRVMLFNSVAARTPQQPCMDAMLKHNRTTHPLEITLRAGVRAVLVELGTITPHSVQWRRAIDMVSETDRYKHYCYMGTSVSLQKSLLQAIDLHAHELLSQQLQRVNDPNDHALKRLHSELRQKRLDVRGRGSRLFRDWFFHNPISFLRECDGDRCEFWRFRYPERRELAMNALVEQATRRFPPSPTEPLIISAFGSGLLYQEFCHVCKLIQAGYTRFRLLLVDTAYTPWKQKYLARDGCCRIYVQPSSELHADMLRPAPAYSAPGTTKETLENAASTSVNNAISFIMYNEALFQFVQWFATHPHVDVQILAYDSVDSYIADCELSPNEVMAHICSAIDYKDNDKLLEDQVNHMAGNTMRPDGVCIKLVTRTGETLPGIYIEDRSRQVLHAIQLPGKCESHFDGLCVECEP